MSSTESLDQRYLEFTEKTNKVFAQFPQIEPLRYVIFRDLLVQPPSMGLQELTKRLIRPLVRHQRTTDFLQKENILIWVESTRQVIHQALLPVFHELTKRGEKVRLVSFNGPDDLPPTALRFRFPAALFAPSWAKRAWEALCETEQKLGKRALERLFLYACANVQSLLDELTHVLDTIEPQIVVTASTQLMGGSALLIAARSIGIRTLVLQHGLLQPLYVPILADVMCTWGQSSSDTLARLGIEQTRLLPLGSPRHDAMGPSNGGMAKQALVRCLDLKDKSILVFFSNGNDLLRNGSAPMECANWLEAIAKKYFNSLNVIVRLHPNEDGSLYGSCPHLVMTKDRPELGLLLDGCDCVTSLCSTAMHEALLYNKPVWQFYADGWPELAENWKTGLARRISSERELSEMIEQMLSVGIQERPARDIVASVFENHGRATQAVADFIVSQLHY